MKIKSLFDVIPPIKEDSQKVESFKELLRRHSARASFVQDELKRMRARNER